MAPTVQRSSQLSAADFDALRNSIRDHCNAIEIVAPERRGFGFTSETFAAPPRTPPIIG